MQGQKLRDRYQIIKKIGSGGFGDTYLAHDLDLPGKPLCVVKHFNPKSLNHSRLSEAKRLFEREAEILHKLGGHPQIPRLMAHFEEGSNFFLVQEFFDGNNLSEELEQPLTEEQTIKF